MQLTLAAFVESLQPSPIDMQSSWYRAVLLRDVCVYCNETPFGLDHIQPRSTARRGTHGARKRMRALHVWTNRAPACRRCDRAKADTPLLVWLHRVSLNGLPRKLVNEESLHRQHLPRKRRIPKLT